MDSHTTVFVRLIDNQERVLMVENTEKDLPNGNRKPAGWGLPGGGLEPEELPIEAGLRELYEETGVTTKLNPDFSTIDWNDEQTHCVMVFDGAGPEGFMHLNDPEQGVRALRWFTQEEIGKGNYMGLPIYRRHRAYAIAPRA